MNEEQIVVFNLNDEMCGIDIAQVQEIVQYQEPTKVPDIPDYINGIVNLRGNVVPIIDLNQKFHLGGTEITKKTKIIITNIKGKFIGFIVNDVNEIIKLSEKEIELPPEIIYKKKNICLKGVGKHKDKLISILDLDSVLDLNDIDMVTIKGGEA